jgi:hypothetical protein
MAAAAVVSVSMGVMKPVLAKLATSTRRSRVCGRR